MFLEVLAAIAGWANDQDSPLIPTPRVRKPQLIRFVVLHSNRKVVVEYAGGRFGGNEPMLRNADVAGALMGVPFERHWCCIVQTSEFTVNPRDPYVPAAGG